ncbi:2-amino-4-hydroxy-6-hydroxymethyldihydropteridine diphosphokinase [Saccharomonospora sp. NPDC046836]|uniref:2-amino-4-hydroxy-6- hydroxymethyldihydropteridine diphosphokinase n=1 Tax=Saccharomonospora sp. NPDC046836 TaxID=3156921 RepID=UPI0033D33BC2
MSRAVLSLGSNLGDRLGYLRLAVDGLRDVLVAVSSVYETKPWGVTDQPDFLNAVCIVDDPEHDHWAWLRTGQALEREAERVREQRWGPRTLDVDVVTVDGIRSADPELLLPHPGIADRATVLIPWLEIDPAAEVPGRGSAAQLLAALPEADRVGVRLRGDLSLYAL